MADSAGAKFERLLDIMRTLREPGGCPWDREQTHASLRPFVLEETYEVLEAIEHGTPDQLREELGDFLFEAVFLSRISEEAGDFDIGGVIDAICDKLVRRHPHVFGDTKVSGSAEVLKNWEQIKAVEKKDRGALEGIPTAMPALLRAVLRRAPGGE
jgi:MazG family protein